MPFTLSDDNTGLQSPFLPNFIVFGPVTATGGCPQKTRRSYTARDVSVTIPFVPHALEGLYPPDTHWSTIFYWSPLSHSPLDRFRAGTEDQDDRQKAQAVDHKRRDIEETKKPLSQTKVVGPTSTSPC